MPVRDFIERVPSSFYCLLYCNDGEVAVVPVGVRTKYCMFSILFYSERYDQD